MKYVIIWNDQGGDPKIFGMFSSVSAGIHWAQTTLHPDTKDLQRDERDGSPCVSVCQLIKVRE